MEKLLAKMIKSVIRKVIDKTQSAFVMRINLLDNVLLANEVVNEIESRKVVIMKVEYKKTYDSVNWEFLSYMMDKLGFNKKWIGWTRGCLEYATILVLVNGNPTKEFNSQRDLRQVIH